MTKLSEVEEQRLTGTERFHYTGSPGGISVLDFWQWSASNLAENNLRGHLAEFLVASDLGVADGTRWEWADCDIWTPSEYRIEVKSAAYIQQWAQAAHSKIFFSIAPAYGWDEEAKRRTETKQRNSDAYVFCLIETKDSAVFDPLDLDQWAFYVVATNAIDDALGEQKTLSLSGVESLPHRKCKHGEIDKSLRKVLGVERL
jgi:hypothetical protein